MGKTIGTMCNYDSYCLKKEKEKEINELNEDNTFLTKRRTAHFNTFEVSRVISEAITIKKKTKNSEENMIVLNTDKNTFPSNKEQCLDGSLGLNSIDSICTEKIEEEKNIEEEEKSEKNNIKLTNLGNSYFRKTLFNQKSIMSIKNFNKLFRSKTVKEKDEENEEDEKEEEKKNEEENKNEIITYRGEVCSFAGELIKKHPLYGSGILTLNSGEILEGNFIDGKLHKRGKYTDENGNLYEGDFTNGVLNGKGSIIMFKHNKNKESKNIIDKIEYFGDIKNFKKEGIGIEKCKEYIYEGEFHDNMKDGKGKIKYNETGDEYEGEFQNDKINGFGKYKWGNKCEYSGYFLDGEMNGQGKFKWPNGNEYEGEYAKGIRHGFGQFKWNNGKVFRGFFKNGKPKGKGILELGDDKYNAEYKKGNLENIKAIFNG